MPTKEYCAYNETRENFLTPRITVIDTQSEPLRAVKVLIEGLAPGADSGLWLNPLKNIPAVPRLSAYDLVYLDREGCVVHSVELVPDEEAPRFDGAASALVLPIHSFAASQAHAGDRVILRPADEQSSEPVLETAAASIVESVEIISGPNSSNAPKEPKSTQAPISVVTAIRQIQPLAWPQLASPLQLQDAPAEPKAPSLQKAQSRFDFLCSIVRLRIRVQISISTAPPSVENVPQPVIPFPSTLDAALVAPPAPHEIALLPAPNAPAHRLLHRAAQISSTYWDSFQSKIRGASAGLSRLCVVFVTGTLPDFVKHTVPTRAARLRRITLTTYNSCKISYLRWADGFMFRATHGPDGLDNADPSPTPLARRARFLSWFRI